MKRNPITLKKVLLIAGIIMALIRLKSCSDQSDVSQEDKPTPPPQTETTTTESTRVERRIDGSVEVTTVSPTSPDPTESSATLQVARNVEATGLEYKGISGNSPFTQHLDSTPRMWFVSTTSGMTDALDVSNLKGVMVKCKGPVVYEIVTRKDGKQVRHKVKSTSAGNDLACYWDETTKTWSDPKSFSPSNFPCIDVIWIYKDPDVTTESPLIEIGFLEP